MPLEGSRPPHQKRTFSLLGSHSGRRTGCVGYRGPRYLRRQGVLTAQDALHERAHAELAGDVQPLIQQRHCLRPVAGAVALEQGVGVVAAGPGQLGAKARLAAEGQGKAGTNQMYSIMCTARSWFRVHRSE